MDQQPPDRQSPFGQPQHSWPPGPPSYPQQQPFVQPQPAQGKSNGTKHRQGKRVFLSVVAVFLVLAVSTTLVFIFLSVQATPHTRTSRVIPPLPTPGAARTTYTNTRYGYTFSYPTQWHLQLQDNDSLTRVFMKFDPSVPQAVAFEIRCDANPNQLDAKTYWQHSQPSQAEVMGKGVTTLSSGTAAYMATGQGQTPFTLYTLTHQQVACTILLPETDPFNAQVALTTIKSFHWQ